MRQKSGEVRWHAIARQVLWDRILRLLGYAMAYPCMLGLPGVIPHVSICTVQAAGPHLGRRQVARASGLGDGQVRLAAEFKSTGMGPGIGMRNRFWNCRKNSHSAPHASGRRSP